MRGRTSLGRSLLQRRGPAAIQRRLSAHRAGHHVHDRYGHAITILCVTALPTTGYPVRLSDLKAGFSLDLLALPVRRDRRRIRHLRHDGRRATELYAYPYWCLEKGDARFTGVRKDSDEWVCRARGWIRVMYLDAWVSMVVFTIATVCFYFFGATVLHRQKLHPKGSDMIATLSEMYVPIFGGWTKLLFLVGVWAVLFKTLYVASAGHSRMTADFLNLASLFDYPDARARNRWIRRLCVASTRSVALALYLFSASPAMVIFGGFFQGITLPVIAAIAVSSGIRRSDPRLAPSRLSDVLLWAALISISVVAIYASWERLTSQILPGFQTSLV